MVVLYGDRNAPPDDKVIDVYLHHLRKKLALVGMVIEKRSGHGWSIPAGDKAEIAAMRRQELAP